VNKITSLPNSGVCIQVLTPRYRLSAAIIMSTMYDHDVAPKNDFFVDLAETAMSGLKYTVLPGSMLVNELPILRFIPTWFPGAGFKRIALEVRKSVLQIRDVPFASVEKKLVCDLSYHFLSPIHDSYFIARRQDY
jgi:hypothetical protein